MKTKLLLINNPISGGSDKTDILEQISKELDSFAIAFEIYNTSGNQDSEKIQDLLAQKTYVKIIVLGGDGSVLMVARANMKHNIPIGIIPLGSANGLATDLKIDPKPLIAFKNHLCSEYIEHIDLLKINKEFYGIHIGDVGINANLVEKFSQDTDRGMKTYAKYFMEELNSLDHFKVDIITPDQKLIQEPVIMTAICNSNRYGTGVLLNNIGKISDGKFEKPEGEMTINIDCSKATSTTDENNGKDSDDDKLEGIDF